MHTANCPTSPCRPNGTGLELAAQRPCSPPPSALWVWRQRVHGRAASRPQGLTNFQFSSVPQEAKQVARACCCRAWWRRRRRASCGPRWRWRQAGHARCGTRWRRRQSGHACSRAKGRHRRGGQPSEAGRRGRRVLGRLGRQRRRCPRPRGQRRRHDGGGGGGGLGLRQRRCLCLCLRLCLQLRLRRLCLHLVQCQITPNYVESEVGAFSSILV